MDPKDGTGFRVKRNSMAKTWEANQPDTSVEVPLGSYVTAPRAVCTVASLHPLARASAVPGPAPRMGHAVRPRKPRVCKGVMRKASKRWVILIPSRELCLLRQTRKSPTSPGIFRRGGRQWVRGGRVGQPDSVVPTTAKSVSSGSSRGIFPTPPRPCSVSGRDVLWSAELKWACASPPMGERPSCYEASLFDRLA